MKKKEIKIIFAVACVIALFVYAGRIDTQINKENAIMDSIVESNKQQYFIDDPNTVDAIYETLSQPQISEIIYNANRERWDTIEKKDIVEFYLMNPEYYDSIPDDAFTGYLEFVTII